MGKPLALGYTLRVRDFTCCPLVDIFGIAPLSQLQIILSVGGTHPRPVTLPRAESVSSALSGCPESAPGRTHSSPETRRNQRAFGRTLIVFYRDSSTHSQDTAVPQGDSPLKTYRSVRCAVYTYMLLHACMKRSCHWMSQPLWVKPCPSVMRTTADLTGFSVLAG